MSTVGDKKLAINRNQQGAECQRDVEAEVTAALQRTGYRALRAIVCEFDHGTLLLRGEVSSFYMKQIANATVAKVEGIVVIDNQVEVK